MQDQAACIATVWRAVLERSLVLVIAAMMMSGCTREPRLHDVTIRDFRFQPETVHVKPGDSVRWLNQDIVPHSATAASSAWDSGEIAGGSSWQFAPGAAGSQDYICTLHPTMRAVVLVE